MRLGVRALTGPLPQLRWQWDSETDILSGSAKAASVDGSQATIELSDEDGGIAVLDVAGGAVTGLDVVVWPEVEAIPGLAAPRDAVAGRVVLQSAVPAGRVTSFEIEEPLVMRTRGDESLYHLKVGEREVAQRVQVASRLVVELDADGGLAGCWLLDVPPFPADPDADDDLD